MIDFFWIIDIMPIVKNKKMKEGKNMQFSNKDIELFNEAGIRVEDKNYTSEEVEKLKIKVTDFIMSQSSKDIAKYNQKFSNIL